MTFLYFNSNLQTVPKDPIDIKSARVYAMSRPGTGEDMISESIMIIQFTVARAILDVGAANERRRYNVKSSLLGWARTQNGPRSSPLSRSFRSIYENWPRSFILTK